jgi:ribosomal protein S18 acetylase RimI-like enzyme
MSLVVRSRHDGDHGWVADHLVKEWGATHVVSRGRMHHALELPGWVAERDGRPIGVLHYAVSGETAELVTMDALDRQRGVGTALLEALMGALRARGVGRVWLVTSNDNLDALRFYQRRGFVLVAVHRGAIEDARRLKPNIPVTGLHGIPVRDEIELERRL